MKKTTNMAMLAAAALCAALLAAACAMLVRERARLRSESHAIESRTAQYEREFAMDPFPSRENVEMTRKNRDELRKELAALRRSMSGGHVSPKADIDHLQWLTRLAEMKHGLSSAAQQKGITIAPTVPLGFPKYDGGTPPASADVPRLYRQLIIVESLCKTLFAAGIKELISVRRNEFEDATAAPTHFRRAPAAAADPLAGLYQTEEFSFEFRAKQAPLVEVMNRLASNEMFVVVTALEVETTSGIDTRLLQPPDEAEKGKGKLLRMGEAVTVSGLSKEEPAKVRLDLTVYIVSKPEQDME